MLANLVIFVSFNSCILLQWKKDMVSKSAIYIVINIAINFKLYFVIHWILQLDNKPNFA